MAWHRCGRRGVIEAVTGSGKTDVALTAIDDAVHRGLFALVIVPSRVLMEQWFERLGRWMPDAEIGRLGDGYRDRPIDCDVLITTRHSAASRVPLPTSDRGGILVADECHGFGGSVLRKSLLPEYQERLGLTATLERSDDAVETILLPYFGGICYRYDFASAIADGVCAQPAPASWRCRSPGRSAPNTTPPRAVSSPPAGSSSRSRASPTSRSATSLLPSITSPPTTPAPTAGPPTSTSTRSSRREIVATSSAKYEALGKFAEAIRSADGALLFTETVCAANHAIVRLDPVINIEIITGDTGRSDRSAILEQLRDGTLDAVAALVCSTRGSTFPTRILGSLSRRAAPAAK